MCERPPSGRPSGRRWCGCITREMRSRVSSRSCDSKSRLARSSAGSNTDARAAEGAMAVRMGVWLRESLHPAQEARHATRWRTPRTTMTQRTFLRESDRAFAHPRKTDSRARRRFQE
ncbi:Uncharacterised protein [Xylophilus ampelinus]|nr:Uncharacterised protein [Xylophilus ampelinus]